MTRYLSYVTCREDGRFVVRCLDLEVASDGLTEEQAVGNLKEALELYFDGRGDALSALPQRAYVSGAVVVTV